jgi:hypothetical protein
MIWQPFTIQYDGREIVIPADKITQAIAVVEDVITFDELNRMWSSGNYKRSKLRDAFVALLRFAGDKADADALYKAMYTKAEALTSVVGTCQMLMLLMIPPPDYVADADAAPAEPGSMEKKS